ncbi:class I SAM-dependent methyltransferase [Candidatus Borrarchaeum sp.]|uniref:class I SAM-dependent methyltransferase n=1 Tax=Candidatus Borrarchaeum sp. TaxID=2846742 RepID=UPI00257E7EC7|nr:class I SAM-dependent methyltransferase [Candidatus Borrarchaeum sp.]
MSSKKYFDDVASQWDKMRETFFSEAVREKAFAVASIQPDQLAADIGVGTGFITEGLLQRGLKVIAIDQSDAMLQELKKKFQCDGKIDYRKGEAEKLPIEDEIVDYVFANMFLHHVESPPVAINEMVRILKPDGKLIITDIDEHNFEFLKKEQYDRWMGFKREDVKLWFIKAGLKEIMVDCVGENCCAPSCCGDEYASVSIFVASGKKVI